LVIAWLFVSVFSLFLAVPLHMSIRVDRLKKREMMVFPFSTFFIGFLRDT
jgi:hypothetical protein